jgi:glycosyltransferase involved in cell wall biosynthesis
VGNIPHLIEDGVTGYLVPPTPEKLAQRVLEVWRDPRRGEVGAAGRTTGGARRSYEVMAAEVEEWAARVRNPRSRRSAWI